MRVAGERRCRWSAAAVAGVLLVVACSGGDDDADNPPPTEDQGVQLPADDDDAAEVVTGDVEALLAEYSRTVNGIIADPAVARDPSHPLVVAYVDLFEADSQLAAEALAGWEQQAAGGVTIEPVNDEHPALVSRLDGPVEITSPDEVHFPTCDEHRYIQYDAEGAVDDLVEETLQHGEGVAVRVDGGWRLRDLRNLVDGQGCQTTGTEDEG